MSFFTMQKPIKEKKLKKRNKKPNNEEVILDEYDGKNRRTINYDKDKPPHW